MKAILANENMELGSDIALAASLPSRLKGLLGKARLEPGEGLLIRPCAGIHTFFMRFPIDVVFLDKNSRILAIHENLGPFRVTPVIRTARSVLELPAGTVGKSGARIGDEILFS